MNRSKPLVPAKRQWSIQFTRIRPSAPSRHDRAAFTLVELLVVIGIITILIGLLLPDAEPGTGAGKFGGVSVEPAPDRRGDVQLLRRQ